MKKAKTLLSVLLALTLVLALGTSAYAAGTITVSDPGSYTYKAYKIFDAAESGGNVSYTLAADSEWKDVLMDASGKSLFDGLTFTPDADPATKYTVVKGNTFSAADFADFLRGTGDANLSGKTGTDFSGTPVQASVDPGYYLVISNDGTGNQAKAALTTVLEGENVNIQNKNDMPFDKEIDKSGTGVKEDGVQIGDTVNFKLTGKVPADIESYSSYIYLVSDTMDAGLTFDKTSLRVTIDGTPVTLTEIESASVILDPDQYRVAPNANGKTFELYLDLKNGAAAEAPIEITYSATVNENAAGTVTENNAVLEYGHDPSDLTVKDSQTKVYTSKLIIDKFETGAPEQKLSGAEFRLYKHAADAASPGVESSTAGTTVYYYKATKDVSGNVTEVTWDAAAENATVEITDDNGAASFDGLSDGIYYLEEINPPTGYTSLSEPIMITIDGSGSTAVGLTDAQVVMALTRVANIANTPGTNLPSTGGIGTTIFYLVGGVLLLGAVVVLIVRKHQNTET